MNLRMISRMLTCSVALAILPLAGCGDSPKTLTEEDVKRKEAQAVALQKQDDALADSVKKTTRGKGAVPKSVKGRLLSQPDAH